MLWREPTLEARRHVVGLLEEKDGGFRFSYLPSVDEAQTHGFVPLYEFPDKRAEYASAGYLFPTFAERIPSPARPDFKRLMETWGVQRPDDKMEILAKSGGLSLTDRIELAEYRPPNDSLAQPLEMRIAGMRHRDPQVELPPGAAIILRPEPDNPFDPDAVRVESNDGALAGYVPRQYSRLVAEHLRNARPLEGHVIRKLLEPGTVDGLAVVRVRAPSPFARSTLH